MAKELRQLALAAVLSLTALGVFVSIWAGSRADKIQGPTVFARDSSGDLWISVNRDLYEVDRNGGISRVIESEGRKAIDRGIQALVVHPDGDLLVGYGKAEKISRVSTIGGEVSELFTVAAEPAAKFPVDVFKFAVDRKYSDLYLADTRNHLIRVFNIAGEFKRSFGGQGESAEQLHFPNDIRFGPDGLLYVVDTNNHRVGAFNRAGEHRFSIETTSSESSEGMVWPTRMAFAPDGTVFVINKGSGLVGGEIVRLEQKAGVIERIELPGRADPMDLVVVDGNLWVTDEAGCEVLRYTLGGERLENLETGEFEAMLAEIHFQRAYYQSMVSKAQAGLFALFVVLVGIYLVERKLAAREAALDDPLAGRLNLRELPLKEFGLKQQIKLAALLALVFVGGTALLTFAVGGLAGIGMDPGESEANALMFQALVYVCAVGFAMAIFFVIAMAVRDGAFQKAEIKALDKLIDKQKKTLGTALAQDEFVTILAKPKQLNRRMFAPLLAGPLASDQNLLAVTTKRILILTADVTATNLIRAQEISYSRIEKTDSREQQGARRWIGSLFGSGFLSLKLAGEAQQVVFAFPNREQMEVVREEIESRAAHADNPDFPSPRRICLKCFQPSPRRFTACPSCRHAERPVWVPTLCSLIYPGVGQLLNHNLAKGLILFTAASFVIFSEAVMLSLALTGSAEINEETLNSFLIAHLIIAGVATVDAYVSAKR